jgi:hypothetical protein
MTAKPSGSLVAEALRRGAEKFEMPDEPVRESSPLESIFEVEPVDLTTFITDKAYLNNPALSDTQFEAVRHLEQIFLPETYPLMVQEFGPQWEPVRFINFAWLQWGKGSGKDHVCRMSVARWVYLLLCLKNPQAYFGMPEQDEIHVLNVASTAAQAQRAFFKPLKTLSGKARCFKDVADPKEYSIVFDKQIEAVSGHSLAEAMEGLNILGGIADEISAFKTKEEAERTAARMGGREPAKTAESILKMIRTSARTRFPRNFKLAAISYPRFRGDAIQQLTLRGREDNEKYGDRSRVFVSGPAATWDVNPRVRGKEDFREDYDEDPEMARAMYECEPSLSTNRFYRNEQSVYAAFSERKPPPVVVEYYWGRDEGYVAEEGPPPEQEGWQVRFHYDESFYPMQGALYAVHGDMAITGDRAGVAVAHVKNWQRGEWKTVGDDTTMEPRPYVKLDTVFSFEADISAQPVAREVQIRWFRKFVFELTTRGFIIGRATLDQFQSADTIQILESRGIEAERVSMDRDAVPWNNLRDVMYDGRLDAYWRELVVDELLALTRLPNGKVDHPAGGSKDEADAVCGAVLGAVEIGGDEGDEPERADIDTGEMYVPSGGGWGGALDIDLSLSGIDLSPPDL